jgi:FkbM family methyltransferase
MSIRRLGRLLKWWLIHVGPQRDLEVETANGLLTFDSKDWLIGKYLYIRRSYEIEAVHRIPAFLQEKGYLPVRGKGSVLDVGANVGMICIALLKYGYFERAVAFEPAPNSFRLLVKNLEQNALRDRIVCFPCALSSAEGELELELSSDNSGDHRIRHAAVPGAFHEQRRRTVKIQARTLDTVFAEDAALRAEDVALIWLDIQGHEGQFFQGAREVLRRGMPVVSEIWPYAILRSGMSRQRFGEIVSSLFSHFFLPQGEDFEKGSIAEIDVLFDTYAAPRQMCQVLLVRDP